MLFYDVVEIQSSWKQKVGTENPFKVQVCQHWSPDWGPSVRELPESLERIYLVPKLQQNFHPREGNSKDMVLTFDLQWWSLSVF